MNALPILALLLKANSFIIDAPYEQSQLNCDGRLIDTEYTLNYDRVTLSSGDRFGSATIKGEGKSFGGESYSNTLRFVGEFQDNRGRWSVTISESDVHNIRAFVNFHAYNSKSDMTWSLECTGR